MHIWYCICGHYWHIENSLRTALAGGLYARGTWILESEIDKHYVLRCLIECMIAFEIQCLSKRFRCRFHALRKGAWRSAIALRLSTIVVTLSLTSVDVKLLKSTASKSWWKAFSLKCLKSRKNLGSLFVGSVLAIEQNTGRWSEISARQSPDLFIFSSVFVYIWSIRVAVWSVILVGLVIIGIKPKLRSMSRYSDVCLSSLYFNRFSLRSPRTNTSCPLVLSCSNCFFKILWNRSRLPLG